LKFFFDSNKDKTFGSFDYRLGILEEKKGIVTEEEETQSQKIRKCAELRQERIRQMTEIMGSYEEALSWHHYGLTPYELDCELEPSASYPLEQRYLNFKQRWLDHPTSWWARRFDSYPPLVEFDGKGCNKDGCVEGCRFYQETGTVDDDEFRKLQLEKYELEQAQMEAHLTLLGFEDDDTYETKKQKWDEIRKVKNRIGEEQRAYLEQRQHGWQSCDDLKRIEDDAWAEFYKSKNKDYNAEQQ
jgi:hypothetical protein